MKRLIYSTIICILLIQLTGCATIMHTSRQEVGISSQPSGATVFVNGVEGGRTPLSMNLKRKNLHFIKIELDGYLPYEITLTRKTSGWIWGNIIFGGLIGLAVDAITGGMYKLTPEQVMAELRKDSPQNNRGKDNLFITVILEPNPSWEKIGNLRKK